LSLGGQRAMYFKKSAGGKEGGKKAGESGESEVSDPGHHHNQTDAVVKSGADHAPRHPHLLALPIMRRPFFPGLVQAVNITSPKVFEAISAIKQDYGHYYIGW